MRITIAPDSFKGSLPANEVARAISEGIKARVPEAQLRICPMADGGEGTAAVLLAKGASRVPVTVVDAAGSPNEGYWVRYGHIAVVEAAVGSGYRPHAESGNDTTSLGTGQLIAHALNDSQVEEVYVALGGTGCTDGGIGLMYALGAVARDGEGQALSPTGSSLGQVRTVSLCRPSKPIIGLYDVASPLCGPYGAVRMFGPQKGIAARDLQPMDEDMARYARLVEKVIGHDYAGVAGAGAAGGMGFAILAMGGELRPGAAQVAEWTGLYEALDETDWVITGEGRIDAQTLQGKVVGWIASQAQLHHIPAVALVGGRGHGAEALYSHGLAMIYPILDGPLSLEDAIGQTPHLLRDAAGHVALTLQQWHKTINLPRR